MALRLHFPSALAADVSPAYDAGWGFTTEAVRRRLARFSPDTAVADGTLIGPWTANTTTYALDRQYVSDPLTADFTIGGTVSGVIRVLEGNSADNVDELHVSIRVVSNNGSTVRGTLLARGCYGVTQEFIAGSRFTRVIANAQALSSVNALAGDRIVVELGYRSSGGSGAPTSPEARASYGAVEDLDYLPLSDGVSSALNPWIEFSDDIPIEPGVARVPNALLEVSRAVPFIQGEARIDTVLLSVIRSVDNPLAVNRKRVRHVAVSFG